MKPGITLFALFAVMVTLTGVASAIDVAWYKPDGTKQNPVYIRNGENFNLDMHGR